MTRAGRARGTSLIQSARRNKSRDVRRRDNSHDPRCESFESRRIANQGPIETDVLPTVVVPVVSSTITLTVYVAAVV
jgi:hypothetical protein